MEGRPPDPDSFVQEAKEACRRVLEDQGYEVGWRTVRGALGAAYSKYRVQECVAELKADREAARRLVAILSRISVHVALGDVLWSLDETHLGRLEGGEAVLGLVVREVASTRTLVVSVGPAATAEDLIRALEHLRRTRGDLPLVIVMDNGPAMKSRLLADYLAFHEVVALRNLPHVSRHNPTVERGNRSLKEASGLGKDVILHGHEEAAARIAPAVEQINERRLVASRSMRTPVAVDSETPRWYSRVEREAFFRAVCRAIRKAVQECKNDRQRRKAEREAILSDSSLFRVGSATLDGGLTCEARGALERGRGAHHGRRFVPSRAPYPHDSARSLLSVMERSALIKRTRGGAPKCSK